MNLLRLRLFSLLVFALTAPACSVNGDTETVQQGGNTDPDIDPNSNVSGGNGSGYAGTPLDPGGNPKMVNQILANKKPIFSLQNLPADRNSHPRVVCRGGGFILMIANYSSNGAGTLKKGYSPFEIYSMSEGLAVERAILTRAWFHEGESSTSELSWGQYNPFQKVSSATLVVDISEIKADGSWNYYAGRLVRSAAPDAPAPLESDLVSVGDDEPLQCKVIDGCLAGLDKALANTATVCGF